MVDIKVVLVKLCEWQGLYADGKLVLSGHRIELEDGFNSLIGKQLLNGNVSFETRLAEEESLDDFGELPQQISKIKFTT